MIKSISHRSSSRQTSPGSFGERGFTLVEILVAISILAVVLTSVYGVFTSVSKARQRLDADSADYHRARVLFDRIGRELRGAYFQSNNSDLVFTCAIVDDGALELELTTTAVSPLLQAGSGIARVHYLLEKDRENNGNGLVLMRSEHAVHESSRDAEQVGMMRLVPGIDVMTIRFFSDGAWQTRWDGLKSGLPELVEIALQLQTSDHESIRFVSAFDLPEVNTR